MKLVSMVKPISCSSIAGMAAFAALSSALLVSCTPQDGNPGGGDTEAGVASVYVLEANPTVRASAVRNTIAEAGVANLSTLPGGCWLVRATDEQLAAVQKDGLFTSVREYAPSDKGTPPPQDAAPAIYVVSPFQDVDAAAVREAVAAIPGCEVVSAAEEASLRVRMGSAGFQAVAGLRDVQTISKWIEPTFDTTD